MGNSISLFTTTPQEHADKFWASQYQRVPFLFKGKPPRGFVRCKFYFKFEKYQFARQCDIREDIALCRDGSLDLRDVRKAWGLEEIQTIDPARWIHFESTNANYLSRLAVEVLSDVDNCLHFYEPSCPVNVTRVRNARLLAVKTTNQATHLLGTPLRTLESHLARAVETPHFKRYEALYVWMVWLIFSIVFFSSLYFGITALQFQSRWRNVVMTGSFAVSPIH